MSVRPVLLLHPTEHGPVKVVIGLSWILHIRIFNKLIHDFCEENCGHFYNFIAFGTDTVTPSFLFVSDKTLGILGEVIFAFSFLLGLDNS